MSLNIVSRGAGLGVAIALCLSVPAMAGDYNYGNGSIKDYGGAGGVPVPAPVPMPEYAAQWYFRGDAGIGFGSKPGPSRSGNPFGRLGPNWTDAPGPDSGPGRPFGYADPGANNEVLWTSFRDETEFSPSYMFGVGVGRYVSDRFRIDLTAEYRGDPSTEASGTYSYTPHAADVCGNWCPDTSRRIDGSFTDRTHIRSGLFMVNGYWDFASRGHITPYIGAGIGMSLSENERSVAGYEDNCVLGTPDSCATRSTLYGTSKSVNSTLAASFMAGMSFQISEHTRLDMNYRYLYVGGYDVNTMITSSTGAVTASSLKIDDHHEHQIRAGLRWDIN